MRTWENGVVSPTLSQHLKNIDSIHYTAVLQPRECGPVLFQNGESGLDFGNQMFQPWMCSRLSSQLMTTLPLCVAWARTFLSLVLQASFTMTLCMFVWICQYLKDILCLMLILRRLLIGWIHTLKPLRQCCVCESKPQCLIIIF